jgi:hypothetical protein
MKLSRFALVGLLATQVHAQAPNAAALQGIEAAIQGTKAAIEQARAANVDTSALEANLKQFEAQKAALQSGGGAGNFHVSGGMAVPGGVQVTGKGGPMGGAGAVSVGGGAVQVTGKGGPGGGSGTVNVGGIQVTGQGGPGGGSGKVVVPGGITIEGTGTATGGSGTITLPNGMTLGGSGTAAGGATAFPGGQNPAGVDMSTAMQNLTKAMQGMTAGGVPPGQPGGPGAGMANLGPFTGSLMALQSGFAMLKTYGQETADLEKRVQALIPDAKELDGLTMKMMATTASGKLPPEDMEKRYDTLVNKIEPELESISEEMDKRSESMTQALEAQAEAMENNLEASSDAMERALEMQEKMLEAQEQMLEQMNADN